MATAAPTPTPSTSIPSSRHILGNTEFRFVPLTALRASKTNPRKTYDAAELQELAQTVREHGVLEPLLVRAATGEKAGHEAFEVISGERRRRAAEMAKIESVPVRVLQATDDQVLEIQVIENLQRSGLSPLEEAEGYQQLMRAGYDVARIAEKVGRSTKYVYDRVKLLQLTKEAKELLRKDRITAGHAILLARLSAADQERALDDGVFTAERFLGFSEVQDGDDKGKPVSVRELEGWIDSHVRFEASAADPVLFPETVATIKAATEDNEKVVRITKSVMPPDELRQGPPAILGNSWKRADGQAGSKTCEHSVIGQVVLGEGRGQAFNVCVAKKQCTVHWPEQARAAKKVKKAATAAVARGEDPNQAKKLEQARQEERHRVDEARWEKALPALRSQLAAAAKKAPAGGTGALGKMLIREETKRSWGEGKTALKLLPPGGTAESLVRFLGLARLLDHYEEGDQIELENDAKAIGVDVKAILAAAIPPLPTCRKCGCIEAVACVGGCSWIEKPDQKTGKGLCSKCEDKKPASGSADKARNVKAGAPAAAKAKGKARAKKGRK